jgi:hypothetical protein
MVSEGVASINSRTGAHQPSNSLSNFGACAAADPAAANGSFAVAHQPVRPGPTGPMPKRRPSP